ncbi:MAG: mandelate racemase/muconate lactonizing enzyme family protein, partial [Lachnospiraceae bacterium]|nr:mandelate racemase/muconate lactonizing enzyme family protein [Lachnospiraceae bacterium]
GDEVDIIMENHSYPDALGAVQLAKLAEKYHIYAFEEPNTPTPLTVSYIARHTDVPLANGERIFSRWQYAEYFAKGLIQLAQPDVGNCGGISETKKICDMAHAFDVGVQVHAAGRPLATNVAQQIECAIPNFIIHEHHVCNRSDTSVGLTKYNLQPEDGYFTVPDLPGIGNEFLREAIDRAYLYKVIEA